MATGSGKTIVMAMVATWQICNKVAYPQDKRFSKNVFVIAPGLTVKSRLQVLVPSSPGNYYDDFNIVPAGLHDSLRQGRVLIRNWHVLMPLDADAGPKVVKKGPESDEAFVRRVLEDISTAHNIVVLNDEAHHAWRPAAGKAAKGVSKDEVEEATRWVEGLDRIWRARGITTCFDFSATPFIPGGKQGDETLFGWIVSDFGLNDAIEAGLVKTPRVVVRDDGTLTSSYRSRLYHIYQVPEVREDLSRAKAQPQDNLPQLVVTAYHLLAKDWLETARAWKDAGLTTPPVMITVANRTETAARIEYTFNHGKIPIEELNDPRRTLRIDSKVLLKAEARDDVPDAFLAPPESLEENDEPVELDGAVVTTRKDSAEELRQKVDTVGQLGRAGEQIQNVISVAMLSEGWDARTVTHIMGLRAFTSQLLCEQVVGRGLRRMSYEVDMNGLLEPEYVNVFGVPFTFLPHESAGSANPVPSVPTARIEPVAARSTFEITWPNIVRIEHEYRDRLELNLDQVDALVLDAMQTPTLAELAPVIAGKPDVTRITPIDLEELGRKYRYQKIVFETARDVFDQMSQSWRGTPEALLGQVIQLVDRFIASDRIQIHPPLFNSDDVRRRIIITLNMPRVVQHVFGAIRPQNSERLIPVFDTEHPIGSTAEMHPWYTRRACSHTLKSQINLSVYDSTWEATEAFRLDKSNVVEAWVKNDHLGFEVFYFWNGSIRRYRPDFLVKLTNGKTLVIEVKGRDSQEQQAKRKALDEWVNAVNADGRFGPWAWDVAYQPGDVSTILNKHG
jgi:type III restriction enzyme